jgi:hypothetical protein
VEVDEEGYPVDWKRYRKPYINPDFPERAAGIVSDGIYSFGSSYRFRAGGYGSYSVWREALAELAGYPAEPEDETDDARSLHAAACWNGAVGPFSDLINFSDCQGVMGTEVCVKLARDFAEHEEAARAFSGERASEFLERYLDWKQAFELAAEGGMLEFR